MASLSLYALSDDAQAAFRRAVASLESPCRRNELDGEKDAKR